MRILLAYNPSAGDDGVETKELVSLLEAAGHEVEARSLKEEGWEAALSGTAELVVVAGGDGAVAKVFKRLAGSGKRAVLAPRGSANNVAKSLGYGGDDSPEELIRLLGAAARSWFNLGSLAWPGGSRSFVESAGGGVFADMLVRAEDFDEPRGEAKIELGLRLLREAATRAPARSWRVYADGVDLSGDFIAVEIMNVPLLGPNVALAPGADPSDELLELVLARADDRTVLAAYAQARLEGRPAPSLQLDVRRAKQIELRPPAGEPFHFDDELVEAASGDCSIAIDSGLEVLKPEVSARQ